MTKKKRLRVCIIYPADPLGAIPGGIDTYIRGILSWAPPDIEVRVIGITTDPTNRPVRRWTNCQLGNKSFEFYPIMALRNSEKQARVPVVLRFLLALLVRKVDVPADVLEFHRVEPCLNFIRDKRPKTLVMHQNMEVLRNASSDIRWRYFPKLYFLLEDFILPRIDSIYCVREDAASGYRKRFPAMTDRVRFTPTWVDAEVFQPPAEEQRRQGRQSLATEFGFPLDGFILVTVGRLDKQKNPILLIDAFQQLYQSMPDARLLMVGDGVLRGEIEERVQHYDLQHAVKLCGVKRARDISRYLQSADAFVLSSAYEGMPICVLEALGSGLPVVSTDVGEVARVVRSGHNGELVAVHEPATLANALMRCREKLREYRGEACVEAVQPYTPQIVLMPIYENYRRLATEAVGIS